MSNCSCFIEFIKQVGGRDKIRGLPSILSLFRNSFNKFNNTKARMLDSIYHMALKLIKNHFFGMKMSRYCHLLRKCYIIDVITLRYEICKPLVVYRFYCMALFHSKMRHHVIT